MVPCSTPVRHAPTDALGQPLGEIERGRPTDEVAQQAVELVAVCGIVPRLGPRGRQLIERGDERLGDVAAPVGAESLLDRHLAHLAEPVGVAELALSKNASRRSWSLRPGSASTPLATSTANGCVAAIASETFSGR